MHRAEAAGAGRKLNASEGCSKSQCVEFFVRLVFPLLAREFCKGKGASGGRKWIYMVRGIEGSEDGFPVFYILLFFYIS